MSIETMTMPTAVKPLLKENVRALIDHIERSGLAPGARLESERELAKILEISRPSLREAIQVLQTQGRVLVKHGVGVFVLDEATGERFKDAYLSQWANIEELFQMREILEAPAVEWAAERHTSEQLAEMNQALFRLSEALSENPIDFEKVRELDMEFHLVIVRSASNRFLNQTLGTLQEIMRNSMENTLKLPGRIDQSEEEHRIILEAIRDRDPIKARLMIIQHIHNARDAWAKFLKKEHSK